MHTRSKTALKFRTMIIAALGIAATASLAAAQSPPAGPAASLQSRVAALEAQLATMQAAMAALQTQVSAAGGLRILSALAEAQPGYAAFDVPQTSITEVAQDMPGMVASFSTLATGCVIAMFSAEMTAIEGGEWAFRAMLDGVPMHGVRAADYFPDVLGGSVSNAGVIYAGGSSYVTRPPLAYTFWRCNVASGDHVLAIQWMAEGGGTAVLARSLLVLGQ